jgi:hypothetical protein
MQRLSDLVLFGPRLAITVRTETARRVPNLVAGSYRIVSALLGDRLRKSDGAGVASATPEVLAPLSPSWL